MKKVFCLVQVCMAICSLNLLGVAAEGKKNILFISIDDLRPSLGAYGDVIAKSPHLDKLASESVLFEKAYCQQAICGASRASILSGLRPDTSKVYDIHTPFRSMHKTAPTMPSFFKSKGYDTVAMGKVYHHGSDDEASWSLGLHYPKGEWYGKQAYVGEEYSEYPQTKYIPAHVKNRPSYQCLDVPDTAYPDGVLADMAVAELKRLKNSDKNFFFALGFLKPHLPFNAPKKYWDLYDEAKLYQSIAKDWPSNVSAWAPRYSEELRNYSGVPQGRKKIDGDLAKKLTHGYYASVSYVDAQVGKVLQALKDEGLDKNTIVIIWGDHGFKLGDYGSWCKHTNFEIDTHVPLIVKIPGLKAAKSAALVESVDVFPTLIDFTGFEIPDSLEGLSLAPVLNQPEKPWKEAAFSQYPRKNGKVMGYSMRSGQWRYTEWWDLEKNKIVGKELYDHSTAPVCLKNEAYSKENHNLVAILSALMNKGQGWRDIQEKLK